MAYSPTAQQSNSKTSAFPARLARPRVLVTIPVYNEVARILESIEALDRAFRPTEMDYRLAVAEDGSTDGTKELLHSLQERRPNLLLQEDANPLGRGAALRRLWASTTADVYCFTDADLAAGPDAVVTAARKVIAGSPIVIGSRYAGGARTQRPPLRAIASRGYNKLLRYAFGERIYDHQCGLKAFNAEVVRQLLLRTVEDSWFWDTEVVVLALTHGFSVEELPVSWVERKTSRTELRRLVSDLWLHGSGLVRLKSRLRAGRSRAAARPAHSIIVSPSSGVSTTGRNPMDSSQH
jgi:glycosyltransferase AglD